MVCHQRSKCFLGAASCAMRLACDRLACLLRELFRASRIKAVNLDRYKNARSNNFFADEILRRAMANARADRLGIFGLLAVRD
jgi:hypothetical protein